MMIFDHFHFKVDVYKDPATDPGKTSKKGNVTLVTDADGKYKTVRIEDIAEGEVSNKITDHKTVGQFMLPTKMFSCRLKFWLRSSGMASSWSTNRWTKFAPESIRL